ncbi:MAG: carboxyl transferase [Lachnoclostridium sp.]|nr:carboxyl transferase [Lachnoclostridium sp.]
MTNSAMNRINLLLDENSFVEVGAYMTARSTDFNMQAQETPADGVVTGYGTIEGALVYVYSQNAAVMGGSVGEMHAKKIENIYAMAMKMGAPVIGLIDCAGLRLQEGMDALDGFGKLYACQTMASGVIPQIQAVFGNCGGGMAVASAMADFTYMEDKAKLFVNAPNAIVENKADNSTAKYQAEESGNVCATGTEEEILAEIHTLVSILPANNEDDMSYDECEDDLNRMVEGIENCTGDTALALAMISDDNFIIEMKKNYAPSMVTAFIRLNGATVGCVANRTESYEDGKKVATYDSGLTAAACEKAADFVNFCDAFEIPVLTLVNVNGYKNCACNEKKIARAAAKLTAAFANASVPKVTVVCGTAFGTAGLAMNSKSIGADIVYAWENASIGMMDATPAVKIMYAKEIAESQNPAALIAEKAAEYTAMQASAMAAARRGYVDDIIKADETRQRVVAAFEMLFTKREDRPSKKHGTI